MLKVIMRYDTSDFTLGIESGEVFHEISGTEEFTFKIHDDSSILDELVLADKIRLFMDELRYKRSKKSVDLT